MTPLDPTTLSPRQLEELGPHAVHQLALRATNTLTRYRLLLGRCLLALHRSQDYLQFGCSSFKQLFPGRRRSPGTDVGNQHLPWERSEQG